MNVVFLQGGAGGSDRRRRDTDNSRRIHDAIAQIAQIAPSDSVHGTAPQRFTIEYIPTCKYNIKQQHGKLQRTRARQHP